MADGPEIARLLTPVVGTTTMLLARLAPAAGVEGFIVLTHHSVMPARERKSRRRPRVFGLSPRPLKQGVAMRAWVMRNDDVEANASVRGGEGRDRHPRGAVRMGQAIILPDRDSGSRGLSDCGCNPNGIRSMPTHREVRA